MVNWLEKAQKFHSSYQISILGGQRAKFPPHNAHQILFKKIMILTVPRHMMKTTVRQLNIYKF